MTAMDEKRQRAVVAGMIAGCVIALSLCLLIMRLWHGDTATAVAMDLCAIAIILLFSVLGAPRLPSRRELLWIAPAAALAVTWRTLLATLAVGLAHPFTWWFPVAFVALVVALFKWWHPAPAESFAPLPREEQRRLRTLSRCAWPRRHCFFGDRFLARGESI
jgi:hypothetical protein